MRTTHLLPISPSMHCSWGVFLPKGKYLPRGCTCLRGVPAQGRVPARGCTYQGSTCQGVYLLGVPAQVLPPVNRMTGEKILPCPKLRLRVVIKLKISMNLELLRAAAIWILLNNRVVTFQYFDWALGGQVYGPMLQPITVNVNSTTFWRQSQMVEGYLTFIYWIRNHTISVT